MAQSKITKDPAVYEALATFGTYNTVGTELELTKSVRNFKAIVIRCSSDTDNTTGGGIQFTYIPVAAINSSAQYGCLYFVNGSLSHITVEFPTDTKCRIKFSCNVTTGAKPTTSSGIRQIYGIN